MAFFAKGRIKGDFLLTMAYDSAREKEDARDRLHGTIEPDRYYLLYGDGTEQRFEAASQSKLYLKIERRQFVALFGDFDTGFTVTELTALQPQPLGPAQRLRRRARVGVGLRGAHRHRPGAGRTARRRHLGSVSPVARAHRHRLATSCASKCATDSKSRAWSRSRELSRFIDYDLDYERGTVFFKEPVPEPRP